jgi:hypothetical protein
MSVGAVCWPYYLKTRKTGLDDFLWDTGPDAGQLLLSAHDDEWEPSRCFRRGKANAAIATSDECNVSFKLTRASPALSFLYGTLTRFSSRISSATPSPQAPLSSSALTMIFGSQPPARPMPFIGITTNHATRLGPSAPITSAFV